MDFGQLEGLVGMNFPRNSDIPDHMYIQREIRYGTAHTVQILRSDVLIM